LLRQGLDIDLPRWIAVAVEARVWLVDALAAQASGITEPNLNSIRNRKLG
jgi:hypothetical protein